MNIWEILGIEATGDVREIKRAYARMSKNVHPEDDPEGFLRLREAYESALELSRFLSENDIAAATPPEPPKEEPFKPEQSVPASGSFGDIDFDSILEEQIYAKRKEAMDRLKGFCKRFSKHSNDSELWDEYLASEAFIAAAKHQAFLDELAFTLQQNEASLSPLTLRKIYNALDLDNMADAPDKGIYDNIFRFFSAYENRYKRYYVEDVRIIAMKKKRMKKFLIIAGSAAAVLMLIFTFADMNSVKKLEDSLIEKTSYKLYEQKEKTDSYRIICPQIKDLGDEESQNIINRILKEDAVKSLEYLESEFFPSAMNITIDYCIATKTEDFISVVFFDRGNNRLFLNASNIDLTNTRRVSLADRYKIDSSFVSACLAADQGNSAMWLYFGYQITDKGLEDLFRLADTPDQNDGYVFSYYTRNNVAISIYSPNDYSHRTGFKINKTMLHEFIK